MVDSRPFGIANWGPLSGGRYDKDSSVLGSTLGFPYFGRTRTTWKVRGLREQGKNGKHQDDCIK